MSGRKWWRNQRSDGFAPRAFRVPGVPFLPGVSIACCLVLMLGLPLETWLRFVVWLGVGLVIYFAFSRRHSTLGQDAIMFT